VHTEGLQRRFGPTLALRGVDLEVEAGEIYGFLGPNGAGKSTLIRILCTLVRPSAGRAVVAGHDVVAETQEVRSRIGCALQEAALDDGQTGRELLRLQGRLYGLRRRDIRRRLDEVLDLVSIGDAIDRQIGTYSGGMKRRVDLAAALVHDPDVLFLDEPTTGLDPDSRDRVWEEVTRLNRQLGKSIFLSTQYLEEADALADRVGIISRGVLVAEGRPRDLKRSVGRDVIEAEIGRHDPGAVTEVTSLDLVDSVVSDGTRLVVSTPDAAAAVSPVAMALARRGLQVSRLAIRTPTLDDVFREMTRSHAEPENVTVGATGPP
jgi:ABC-2 type transport system ATP-binding protein